MSKLKPKVQSRFVQRIYNCMSCTRRLMGNRYKCKECDSDVGSGVALEQNGGHALPPLRATLLSSLLCRPIHQQNSLCFQCAKLGPLALPVQVYRQWILKGLDIDIVPQVPAKDISTVRCRRGWGAFLVFFFLFPFVCPFVLLSFCPFFLFHSL